MEKISVNIITGFLGAGKTTAIIKLLGQKISDDQWAVIINEFGKISIDTKTLQSASDSENVYEITGGCICCTAKGYLNETLEAVIQSGKYSRIIIEPTGLGGVDMVSEIVASQITLELKPIICLVDVNLVQKPKLMMIPIFRAQIVKSDSIIFTKTDLISDDSVLLELKEQFLKSFPGSDISNEKLNISLLDGALFKNEIPKQKFSLIDTNLSATNFLQKSYTFDYSTIFDSTELILLLQKHISIIRAKGFIRTEMGWKLLNFTLTECLFEDAEDGMETEFVIIMDKSEPYLANILADEIGKTIHLKQQIY
jgi:G3E family GTPase